MGLIDPDAKGAGVGDDTVDHLAEDVGLTEEQFEQETEGADGRHADPVVRGEMFRPPD